MFFLRVTAFAKWPRHVRVRPERVRIHEVSLDGDLHWDRELQSRKHPLSKTRTRPVAITVLSALRVVFP